MSKQSGFPSPEGRDNITDRRAGALDLEIGQRIKQVRSGQRISQDALAERLGISCQQLQKYENGLNRISVTRLVDIAKQLHVEVAEFLAEATVTAKVESDGHEPIANEIAELVTAFCGIRNGQARARVLDMVRFFSSLEKSPPARVED